ncbi:MAG TPA: hypothetical protein VMR51_03345 [Patescibacteria group bacterium]|nr:hypothetical protein [Patescibacteria group bacterium]
MAKKTPENPGQDRLFQAFPHGSVDGPIIIRESLPDFGKTAGNTVLNEVPVEKVNKVLDAINRRNKSGRTRHMPDFMAVQKLKDYGGIKAVDGRAENAEEDAQSLLDSACTICAFNGICRFAFNIDKFAGEEDKKYNLYYGKARKILANRQKKDPTYRCDKIY